MTYRNLNNYIEDQEYGVGICFDAKYPGIRRACLLDMVGGVMSVTLGGLLIIVECFSAYINERDVSLYYVAKCMLSKPVIFYYRNSHS